MLAAAGGRADIVALLVEEGADVNQINPVSLLDHFSCVVVQHLLS